MSPDPKLVEVVARAMFMSTQEPEYAETAWEFLPEDAGSHGTKRGYRDMARAAFAAIAASGEWWIAPWTIPSGSHPTCALDEWWQDFRDAHLKDTGTDK